MIGGIISKIRNFREYMRRGGIVKVVSVQVATGERLKGKRILITGGGSGIGLAIARRCVQEAGAVMIVGRSQERLQAAVKLLESDNAHCMPWDVCSIATNSELIAKAEEKLGGPVDILVNNAGISNREGRGALTLTVWEKIIKTNLTASTFMMQGYCEYAKAKALKGVVLNIASFAGIRMVCDAYGASKAALIKLTEGFAKNYAPFNIRINAIAPGVIVGTNLNKLQREISSDGNIMCNGFPSGRFGVPAEIAEAAVFLISDESSYIYGQTLVCDGGGTL